MSLQSRSTVPWLSCSWVSFHLWLSSAWLPPTWRSHDVLYLKRALLDFKLFCAEWSPGFITKRTDLIAFLVRTDDTLWHLSDDVALLWGYCLRRHAVLLNLVTRETRIITRGDLIRVKGVSNLVLGSRLLALFFITFRTFNLDIDLSILVFFLVCRGKHCRFELVTHVVEVVVDRQGEKASRLSACLARIKYLMLITRCTLTCIITLRWYINVWATSPCFICLIELLQIFRLYSK